MRVPMAPLLWAPPDNTVKASNTPTMFTWRYGGQVYRAPVVWRRVNHFVLCIQEFTQLTDMKCEHPPGAAGDFSYAAPVGDFASRPGATGGWGELIRFYDHEVDTLPSGLKNKQLMWTVSACASTSANSCNMAIPPRLLFLTDKNLSAIEVDEACNGINVAYGATFENTGQSDSGSFRVKVQYVEIRLNASQRPEKDLTKFDPNTDHVFTKRGEIVLIRDFTGGLMDHKGVVMPGGFQQEFTHNHAGLAPMAEDSFGDNADIPDIANHSSTNNLGLALVMTVDSNDDVIEFNEDDNFDDDRGIYPRDCGP